MDVQLVGPVSQLLIFYPFGYVVADTWDGLRDDVAFDAPHSGHDGYGVVLMVVHYVAGFVGSSHPVLYGGLFARVKAAVGVAEADSGELEVVEGVESPEEAFPMAFERFVSDDDVAVRFEVELFVFVDEDAPAWVIGLGGFDVFPHAFDVGRVVTPDLVA